MPYTTEHVVTQLQLLLFSALAFTVLMRTGVYPPELRSTNLDFDWFYRRLGGWISRGLNDGAEQAWDRFMARADATLSKVNSGLYRFHGPDGIFGRTWPTGQMAFWTTVMLGAYVLLSYV